MTSTEDRFKRWLHPAVFAAWSFFLIYLMASRRYVAFLRPEFGILLAIAHFIAMGFMTTAMTRSKAPEMNASTILRTLVLLVPIIYSMVIPDAMLGNQAFKKRFLGTANDATGRQDQSMSSYPKAAADTETALQELPQERTLLEILFNPGLYDGQEVSVRGMILRDDQLKPHFGGRDTVVYRFLINCCAADALPLAIALPWTWSEKKISQTTNGCKWRVFSA